MIGNVPDGWKVKKLSECGKIITGKTPSKTVKEYWNSNDISFIKPDDFTKNTIIEFDKGKDFVSYKGFEKNPTIPPYSVLTTCIGNIGKVLINKNEATTNQQINTIVPNKDINYKFLAYSILKIKPIMLQRANAPVVPMINKTDFGKYQIPIPPLPQQEKIVKVLDISSALIEKQKLLLQNYDLFLKSKFIEMFGNPIKNPMGWEVEKLGNITKIQTGKTPSRKNFDYWNNGTVNWAKTTEVNQIILTDTEEQITDLAVKECNMIFFPKNTILIAMYGQGKTRGKVVLLGVPTTINQAFGAILKNESFNTLFLLKLLDYLYETIRDLGRGGNQENLNLDIVRGIKVILPPITLQNKFASIVEKTEIIKTKETKKLEHLQTLHKSLMDKAFKGEIG